MGSAADRFRYIDPPFQLNAPAMAQYPAEVTGFHLLKSLCRRLGWTSLAERRVLDFGCGVRFARTIYNLDLEIGLYAGVDVNADAIAWLRQNIDDPRFRFEPFDMRNELYNPGGRSEVDPTALSALGLRDFDAACMFSVITHQAPRDARMTFALLRETVSTGGRLYFTAFTDDDVDEYREGDPAHPGHLSLYRVDYLRQLVSEAGWNVEEVYPKSQPPVQQTAFVCRRAEARATTEGPSTPAGRTEPR
jgi:SAM-dependent methyltransferase